VPWVDRVAPLRFLETAFQPDDWVAVFLKSYATGRVAQRVGPVSWVSHPRFQAWLRLRNAQRFNVYVAANAIVPGRRSRTREAIGSIRHIFLDADYDGPGVLARIERRGDLPEPSYVLHSSPNRVHVFWRVAGFDADQAEAVQRALARDLGTDPAATPTTQMTRLPGFMNHKYSPAVLVTIEYRSPDRVLTSSDFPAVPWPSLAAVVEDPGPASVGCDRVERARRYLARVPPAVAGEHGDIHTFRVCCRLARGFGLDDGEALAVLESWNGRCRPPWSEPELLEKLRRARRYGREPVWGLVHRPP